MSSIITLELRQAEATQVNANGDFECQLAGDGVVLENGDVFTLKSAMLDSIAEQSLIILPDNITVSTQSCPYIIDTGDFSASIDKTISYNGNTNENKGTLQTYVPYQRIPIGVIGTLELVLSWNYTISPTSNDGPAFYTTTYQYTDQYGATQLTHGKIPKQPSQKGWPVIQMTDTFSAVVAKVGTFKNITSPLPDIYWNVKWAPAPNADDVVSNVFKPFVMTNTFVLPKGQYSPTEIANLISMKMSQNVGGDAHALMVSKYLWLAEDFDQGYDDPSGAKDASGNPIKIPAQTLFIEGTMNNAFEFSSNQQVYCGASQMALEYDPDAQRFSFPFLHTPMYDKATGKNIVVSYRRAFQQADSTITGISKFGGIFFTSLSATDSTGALYDLWAGQLGFDVQSLCVQFQPYGDINLFDQEGTFFTYSLYDSINTTSGYFGLDSTVQKTTGDTANWWLQPTITATGVFDSTINDTNKIRGTLTLPELLNRFSHYILMCDLQMSDYIARDHYKNIQGLITKYYSMGNYTYGDNSNAFQYQHKGAPLMINSIKCRVLKSDKTLDPLLGSDNTIFFSVIKNTPQLVKSIN